MKVIDKDQNIFEAKDKTELAMVLFLSSKAVDEKTTCKQWIEECSDRISIMYDIKVRTNTLENFVDDLLSADLLTLVH